MITMAVALPSAVTARRFVRMQRYLRMASGLASLVFGVVLIQRGVSRSFSARCRTGRRTDGGRRPRVGNSAGDCGVVPRNARDLPWRRTRDAYQILVSELMLQQTQVSRVVTWYGEFLEHFPTLGDVARAKPARVTEAWEGLGYYARARNLHRLAREVTDGGRPPERALPADAESASCLASARTRPERCRRSPTSVAPRW